MYLNDVPGFADLQVNGFMNVDFTSLDLTCDSLQLAVDRLVQSGTAALCPTVVTASEEAYRHVLRLIVDVMNKPLNAGRFLGIHLEGPFISPQPGARGVHSQQYIRPPSIDYFKYLYDLAEGNISILTVAPEEPGAMQLIEYAAGIGVTVSLGHHLADDLTIDDAVAAGAKSCTHIGNGLPNLIPRHNNPLWKELSEDRLQGMFITDGHHLPVSFIKTALRSKGIDRFIVTSDAAALAGMPVGTYDSFGKKVVVEESGRIFCPQTQSLAGSHSTMLECINFLASMNVLSLEQLLRVGLYNPLQLIDRKLDSIESIPGAMSFSDNRFSITSGDRNE